MSAKSDIAVSVRGLSKAYTIAHNAEKHTTAAEALLHRLKNPFQRQEKETFWALKDVEFDIKKGDVVGIIGRNGAGKSTLLKILSRITEPTTGSVALYGRVGSLLEVGTGFHPELTGRENIYLNGAILGMNKSEIARQFDAIVDFSGTEQFLDTPVKRYSSGMYVRLAFAVAAHLKSEILIVDEVLAVGDAQFQKKCIGKMQEVARMGLTVLVVSHNVGILSALCMDGIMLRKGEIIKQGPIHDVVGDYFASFYDSMSASLEKREDRIGTGIAKITDVKLLSSDNKLLKQVFSGIECKLVFYYKSNRCLNKPTFKFTVYNSAGQPLFQGDSSLVNDRPEKIPLNGEAIFYFNRLPLSAGTYLLNVSIEECGELLDHVVSAFCLEVEPGNYFGTGRNIVGLKEVCLVEQHWEVNEL